MEERKMKRTTKFAVMLMLVCAFAMVLAGCGGSKEKDEAKEDAYKVGIIQLIEHPALDEATKGFKEGLQSVLGEDGVVFDEQNAQGEDANCATIASGFVTDKVDLIMANATPALQASANATADIPIVGTSVTDFGSALDIKDWTGSTGKNITGTSDLAPLDEQAKMVQEIKPDVKQVGILYCSKESNSKYQVEEIMKQFDDLKIKYKTYSAADSNEVQSVATKAASECDVFYIPTDNTMASSTETIKNVIMDKKIPVVAGEQGVCSVCGSVTLSISYYDIGFRAGEMAAEILRDGRDPGEMPVETAPKVTKLYNKEVAEAIGLEIPEGYEEIKED